MGISIASTSYLFYLLRALVNTDLHVPFLFFYMNVDFETKLDYQGNYIEK